MQKSGLIKDAITSYKLSRLGDGKNDGAVTFGAMDPDKFNSNSLVTFKNINEDGFWEGDMGAFKMDGNDLQLSGKTGIIDTGTVSSYVMRGVRVADIISSSLDHASWPSG